MHKPHFIQKSVKLSPGKAAHKFTKHAKCGCLDTGWVQQHNTVIFAGAARRAAPDSMLILCLSVCLSEIISRPLIGPNSRDVTK